MEILPDDKEGGYTAWYPDLPGCLTCSETIEGAIAGLLDAKKAWFEAAIEDEVAIAEPASNEDVSSYSGQFRLRMPKSLHMTLAINAKNEGVSMNQYCNYLLSMNNATYKKTNVVS